MLAAFRSLGIAAWCGCILTLLYQSLTWVITASWPSLTMMDVGYNILGLDLAALIQKLPLQAGIKVTYFLISTELSITFWWLGVFFFCLAIGSKVIFNK